MTPRELSALITTVVGIVGTVWYIYLLCTDEKMKPVAASWIVLFCTMTLSFVTYWTTKEHNWISNIANLVGAIDTGAILVTVWILKVRRKMGWGFTKFQLFCLWVSLTIAIYWIVSVWGFGDKGILPNILTQVLMVIGYLMTVIKLWGAKKNSESLFLWWSIAIASAIAIYTAWVSKDKLAMVFAVRATVAAGTLVVLMHLAERRARAINA